MKHDLLIPAHISRNNFDIIRFILASSVIVCHCYAIFYGWELFAQNEPFMKWSGGKISIGSAAVNFFFVISGFLILRSLENSSNIITYFKKRILRIYPGFIVAFVISLLILAPLSHLYHGSFQSINEFIAFIPLKKEFSNMLSLQSPIESIYFTFLPQSGLNNSLWTIQYEFICYLLLPVLVWLGLAKHKIWLLVILSITYTLLILQYFGTILPFKNELSGGILSNPYYYPRFFTYFLSGCCIYAFKEFIPRSIYIALPSLLLFISAFKLQLIDVIWPITGTYLLFYIAYHTKLSFQNFAKYGDFSYGIYLYGWPIQQLIMLYWGKFLNPLSFIAAVFPFVLISAFISWNLVEKRALKLKSASINSLRIRRITK